MVLARAALTAATAHVRMTSHLCLGVQTNAAINTDVRLEERARSAALERQMISPGTADSLLNVMLCGLNAANNAQMKGHDDLFVRMFRVWEDCGTCHKITTRNNSSRRSAINFITADACQSLLRWGATTYTLTEPTQQGQANVLDVFEHRAASFIQHPTETCGPVCQATCAESWTRNIWPTKLPPFLIVSFPDEPIVYTDGIVPVRLYPALTKTVDIQGRQITYQLIHVIQKTAGHYRDIGIELPASS